MDLDTAAARRAERQRGLITKAQAFGAGLHRRPDRGATRRGRWIAVRRNVYLFVGVPRAGSSSCWQRRSRAGDGVYASHDTALQLFGGPVRPGRIEVSSGATVGSASAA